MSQVEACTRFASALPLVFSKCDEPIYDEPFVAEAYAFVHLLERYRRFSQVLDELLAVGILPMRDRGIDILDVGVGPGPAAFATLDFYQQLAEYAEVHKIVGLHTPPPNLRVVESSLPMVRVMHLISELSGRSGPFHRDLATFNGIDFNEMRATSVEAFISALKLEDITSDTTSRILDWRDEWRFNLGIFSYFLTRETMVEDVGGELTSLFQSMRAGGVVVTLGATAGRKYRRVYKAVGGSRNVNSCNALREWERKCRAYIRTCTRRALRRCTRTSGIGWKAEPRA